MLLTTIVFACALWMADTALTYWSLVASRETDPSPGMAAAQIAIRMEKFWFALAVGSFLTAVWATVTLLTQYRAWSWMLGRRRTWPIAILVGIVFCAATWTAWAARDWLPLFGTFPGQAALGLVLASAAGLTLAWWRARPER
jgi:hypothetical protein